MQSREIGLPPDAGVIAGRHVAVTLATLSDPCFTASMGWDHLWLSSRPLFKAKHGSLTTGVWLSVWVGLIRMWQLDRIVLDDAIRVTPGALAPGGLVEARLWGGLMAGADRERELVRLLFPRHAAVEAWAAELASHQAPGGSAETLHALEVASGLVSAFLRASELGQEDRLLELGERLWQAMPARWIAG